MFASYVGILDAACSTNEELWSIATSCEKKSMESVLSTRLDDDDPIYPTPPLGQDMTQGQFFLSGV